MHNATFSVSVEGNRLKLRGTLDNSDEVRELLGSTFRTFQNEEENNRALGMPDDPEFKEWEEQGGGKDLPEGKIHINQLTGPAYKSVIIDAEEMQLGNGGLNLWIKLVHEQLSSIALRYEHSVFAEILQFTSEHYRHPNTTFLCQPECLLDEKRLRKKAAAIVEKYHVVLERLNSQWIGGILELPGYFLVSARDTVQECVDEIVDGAVYGVERILSHGHLPPPAMNDWRKRLK